MMKKIREIRIILFKVSLFVNEKNQNLSFGFGAVKLNYLETEFFPENSVSFPQIVR